MRNKLLKSIIATTLGLTMAIGVSVGVANNREVDNVYAYSALTEYELITSTNQLVAGANYILGATYNNNNYFVNRTSSNNNRKLTTASINNNVVALGNSIMPLTLGGSAGAWTFHTNDYAGTAGYFNATNTTSSNHLKIIADLDDYSYFSIDISNSNATITCTGKSSRNIIYLYQSSQISCYSEQTTGTNYFLPRLYKEVASSKTLSSITITGSMTKTSYTTADSWDPTGLAVTGTYSDASSSDITASATFSYYSDSTLENQKASPNALGVGNDQTIFVKATVSGISNASGYAQTVSVVPITYSVTYDANGGTGTITDTNSPYVSDATVTILGNSFVRDGYNFVCFNTQADGSGTDYNPNDTFTITANTTLYAKWIYPYTDINNKVTWDLSKVSYNSMTANSASWESLKASVYVEKHNATIATNNYCPPSHSSTRLYINSKMTISPAAGYKIDSIVFTATSNDYASALSGSTWTNATASSNNTKVTVTPTLRMNNVIVTVGGTTGINKIEINYSTYSVLSSIALSGTYPTSFNQGETFSHDGMVVTATYANSSTADVSSSSTWSGYDTSTLGEQTVTVTYSEDGVTKTATYSITVSAAHYITPADDSASGQVGDDDVLSYTYGNLTGAINIVSDATSIVTIGDNVYENGSGLVEINFVGSGNAHVIFKEGDTQLSSVSVTVTRTTSLTTSTLFSASMTSTPSVTEGYEINTENTEKKSGGFHQDKGTADSSICYFVVTKDSALFAREPGYIKLDARLCGGEAKDPLTYNVEACFVDSDGNNIESTKVIVTTGVTTSSTHYVVEMPYSANAYGVKLYHMKANGHNIRYYSFELSYSFARSVKTICGTENKTGDVVTSVSSVVMRFGTKLSDENWTAFNAEHTVTDYGVMFARKAYLDSHSVSSVKAAYETNESLLYVVRRGSGTAPSLSEGNRVFTAYLNIDSSDYATVFCATPFIVAGGQYYFLDEMRYSVKTLAAECQTTHASPLSDEALAILNA